jgi:hypothetical protein
VPAVAVAVVVVVVEAAVAVAQVVARAVGSVPRYHRRRMRAQWSR